MMKLSSDKRSAVFTGRKRKPLLKKLNPIWWLMNDDEQTVDQATWYHPEWPYWRRWFIWNFIRNPAQNFSCYIIGVQDRNYTVIGSYPVNIVQRNDIGELGWHWNLIKLWIPLPFVSYCGKKWVFYIGWQYMGFCRAKLNRKKS